MPTTTSPSSARKLAKVTMFLSDTQGYKMDKKAYSSTLAFIPSLNDGKGPDEVILGGDIVDFDDVKRYRKDPRVRVRLADEINFVKTKIIEPLMTTVGDACSVVYLEGNHEDRLHRYLCDNAPELYEVIGDIPRVLELAKEGIYYETERYPVSRKLVAVHGNIVRAYSCFSAKATMMKYKTSVIMGHTHRMGMYYESGDAGREWVAIENGHMMDMAHCDYVAGPANWQQGFTVIYVYDNGWFHAEQAKIMNGAVYYGGKVWEA